jgi:hypothetical protein
MKTLLAILAILALGASTCAAENAEVPVTGSVFRELFTLELYIDKEHYYAQDFDRVPYVHNGDVYLFKGDEFGLALDVQGDSIATVNYQPDSKKADVTLQFTQEVQDGGTAMMVLHIHNNTKHTLIMDALMTVPGGRGILKTSILPVQPGLSGFESWQYPIVQLALRNIQIAK